MKTDMNNFITLPPQVKEPKSSRKVYPSLSIGEPVDKLAEAERQIKDLTAEVVKLKEVLVASALETASEHVLKGGSETGVLVTGKEAEALVVYKNDFREGINPRAIEPFIGKEGTQALLEQQFSVNVDGKKISNAKSPRIGERLGKLLADEGVEDFMEVSIDGTRLVRTIGVKRAQKFLEKLVEFLTRNGIPDAVTSEEKFVPRDIKNVLKIDYLTLQEMHEKKIMTIPASVTVKDKRS